MGALGTTTAIAVGLAQLVYLAAMVALGARLALLARRTRQQPEALLAAHFLLCCVLGYTLQGYGHAVALEPGTPPGALAGVLTVGYGLSLLGVSAVALFNYRVFRPGTLVGRLLVGGLVGAMLVGWIGWVATGGPARARPGGFFYWLVYGAYTATALWTLVEPLAYYAGLRRRMRIGLADPRLADRFLLWGLGSVARFAMLVIGIGALLCLDGSASDARIAAPTFLAAGLAGVCVAVAYGLAFFPPAAYVRRLARRRTAA